MVKPRFRVAIVTHDFARGGGVAKVSSFLFRALAESRRFEPILVSLATSIDDDGSTRLLSPRTWCRNPCIQSRQVADIPHVHIGAKFVELEFQRYRPRRILTQLLKTCDLIQVVSGTPAWGFACTEAGRPVLQFAATTARAERAARLSEMGWATRSYAKAMLILNERMERSALSSAHGVFAESDYTRGLLRPFVPSERLHLGFPGIDSHLFHPRKQSRRNYILAVGRYSDPRKNVRLLFGAYAEAVRKDPRVFPLVIAGAPPAAKDMQFLQELNIANKVTFVTHPTDAELSELYGQACFFVLSSDEEGLGLVILEAMASGLPIVSTRCGGPETVLLDGVHGTLVSKNDLPALADAIIATCADTAETRRMRLAVRELVDNTFDQRVAAKTYLKVYGAVLGSDTAHQ